MDYIGTSSSKSSFSMLATCRLPTCWLTNYALLFLLFQWSMVGPRFNQVYYLSKWIHLLYGLLFWWHIKSWMTLDRMNGAVVDGFTGISRSSCCVTISCSKFRHWAISWIWHCWMSPSTKWRPWTAWRLFLRHWESFICRKTRFWRLRRSTICPSFGF